MTENWHRLNKMGRNLKRKVRISCILEKQIERIKCIRKIFTLRKETEKSIFLITAG